MNVIFLCPFMDDSALPFIRATNFTWEKMDLKRQAPLELCSELTKSTLSVLINRRACAGVGLPDSDLLICGLLLGKLLRKHLTLRAPRSGVLCCLEELLLPGAGWLYVWIRRTWWTSPPPTEPTLMFMHLQEENGRSGKPMLISSAGSDEIPAEVMWNKRWVFVWHWGGSKTHRKRKEETNC